MPDDQDIPPAGESNSNAVYTVNTSSLPPPRSTPSGSRGGKTVREKRREKVQTLLNQIGAGVFAADQFDGFCILARVDEAANALADLAEQNKGVAKAIDNMTLAGGYVAVAGVIAAMVLPILARHQIIPGKPGAMAIGAFAPPQAQQIMERWAAEYAERTANAGNPDY